MSPKLGLPVTMHLLGYFELLVDGTVMALPLGPQRLAAYLALHGTTPRSPLAGRLWPDATQQRALGCLRTSIWRINRVAPGLVQAAGGALALDPHAEVDVRRVLCSGHRMLTAAQGAETSLAPGVELLPSWEDEWLVLDRERVRQLQLHALEAGAAQLTDEGAFGLALEWALAALRADPLRESAHRAVIRVHLAEGNLAEARRAFDACAGLLRRELGVRPSARTVELLAAAARDVAVTVR